MLDAAEAELTAGGGCGVVSVLSLVRVLVLDELTMDDVQRFVAFASSATPSMSNLAQPSPWGGVGASWPFCRVRSLVLSDAPEEEQFEEDVQEDEGAAGCGGMR